MTQEPASVAAVIVNYAAASILMEHLNKLVRELNDYPDGHVFVVDNNSPNDELAELEKFIQSRGLKSRVTLIDAGANLGFAGGNNLGFDCARARGADYIFFINPDAWPRPGALSRLCAAMAARPQAAVVGARLENADGTPRYCAFMFPTVAGEFVDEAGLDFLRRKPRPAPDDAPYEVDWVSGAAFLFRTRAAGDGALMDAGYFLYFEETDMMLNLKRRGWEIWHDPQARAVHAGGHSTGVAHGRPATRRMPDYWFSSWRRYYFKNHGRVCAVGAALAKLLGVFAYHAKRALRGRKNEKPTRYLADVAMKCLAPAMLGK